MKKILPGLPLPAYAESPVRKGGDECEKGIHRSLGEGGSASAGFAEDVKMPRAAARGASLFDLAQPVLIIGIPQSDIGVQGGLF